MSNKEQLIHDATMELLNEVGVRYDNAEALEILKSNGIRVEEDVAFFTENEIMHWINMAPEQFTVFARNPKHDITIGGDRVNLAPGYGCAFVVERDGTQRPGTIEDYVTFAKLLQMNPDFDTCGGIMIQPNDVPAVSAPIDMFYAALTHSDKALILSSGQKKYMEAIMKAGCSIFGGEQGMLEKPRFLTLANTNSPLSLDGVMLDCMMTFAKYGQPVVIATATMPGSTGPVTLAGTLAMGNAEILAGIAITQMIRPGTPVVYGVQSHPADMKSLRVAGAAPESAIMQGFGANMARFYGVPSRGGGSMTDAACVNVQSGYESMMQCFSSHLSKINFVLHAAGILSSFNSISFDKIISDFEVIRYVRRYFEGFEVNEETLDLEDIKEQGHFGEFVTSDHTMDNFQEVLLSPTIGERAASENITTYFEENIDREFNRLLAEYENNKPQISEEELDVVKDILVANTELEIDQLSRIEFL